MLMANAKKIVGIILLSIGLIIIIAGGILMSRGGSYLSFFAGVPIIGVVLFVIGLILLIASRKNAKKIVGVVILVIGLIYFVSIYYVMYMGFSPGGFIFYTFIGVVIIFPGLVLLLASRKKYSKSLDESITK